MDRAISASEANQRFSEMLRDVQSGESFVVLSRGRPVARVVPIESGGSAKAVDDLLAFLKTLPRVHAGPWKREDLYS
jgi:prevent-host-death family protein